jgi:hypothetical protein
MKRARPWSCLKVAEFPLVDDVAKSVALSTLITPVVRGAFSVASMHVADAPVAGSGNITGRRTKENGLGFGVFPMLGRCSCVIALAVIVGLLKDRDFLVLVVLRGLASTVGFTALIAILAHLLG